MVSSDNPGPVSRTASSTLAELEVVSHARCARTSTEPVIVCLAAFCVMLVRIWMSIFRSASTARWASSSDRCQRSGTSACICGSTTAATVERISARFKPLQRGHVCESPEAAVAAPRRLIDAQLQLLYRRVGAVQSLEQRRGEAQVAHDAVERVSHLVRRHREEVLLEPLLAARLGRLLLDLHLAVQRRLRLFLRCLTEPPLMLLPLERVPQCVLKVATESHSKTDCREGGAHLYELTSHIVGRRGDRRPPNARHEARSRRKPVCHMQRAVTLEGVEDEDQEPGRQIEHQRCGRCFGCSRDMLRDQHLPGEFHDGDDASKVQTSLRLVVHAVQPSPPNHSEDQ
eukprot:4841325-Prymnesium_polylepis.2